MSRPPIATGTARRRLLRGFLVTLTATSGASGAPEPRVLAPPPFCEASAALAAPWDEDLVLAADNERKEQLYAFELDDGVLVPDEVWQMPAAHRPDDVEALARLGEEVVVVGSHSRNTSCEAKGGRQRLRRLARRQDGTLKETGFLDSEAAWKEAMMHGGERCLSSLFTSPAPSGARAACAALVAAERDASGGRCEVLNVEGAFGAGSRLWLGLRAPLVEGRALLLRLVRGLDELRFDRVALLDLEDRGIRDLALAGDLLYGLAGPPLDAEVPFALFRADASEVLDGGEPTVEILRRDLETSSEGLLVRGGRAYVLVDGEEGEDDGGGCRAPARWYTVELP
jgi:hypothetical protein